MLAPCSLSVMRQRRAEMSPVPVEAARNIKNAAANDRMTTNRQHDYLFAIRRCCKKLQGIIKP